MIDLSSVTSPVAIYDHEFTIVAVRSLTNSFRWFAPYALPHEPHITVSHQVIAL